MHLSRLARIRSLVVSGIIATSLALAGAVTVLAGNGGGPLPK